MPEMNSKVTLQSKMHFVGEMDDYRIPLDAGGEAQGARPKGLLLTALAGCTGMDVIAILRKMRVEPEAFSVETLGTVSDEHPKAFTHIHLTYRFKGDLPREKVEKAVILSQDRYCAVSAMLKQVVDMDWDIVIEA